MERPPPPSSPEPGERRPAARRDPLERPPGDRYAVPSPPDAAAPRRGIPGPAGAILIGLAGAAVIVVLGGVLSMTVGLLLVAGGIGWLVGRALSPVAGGRTRRATAAAVGIAVGSVVLGQIGLWLFATSEGGALPVIDYLGQTWGPVAPAQLVVAAAAAALGSR